jgi:hypothetical protein
MSTHNSMLPQNTVPGAELNAQTHMNNGMNECKLPLPTRIAFVGNYLPRQCGIATFTTAAAARRPEKPFESTAGIIPGDRGKDGGSWCRYPLSVAIRSRHYHQLLWPVS